MLRNYRGEVKWLGGRAIPRTRSVLEVEAEGLRWAVITIASLQYNKVIFESDSKELIALVIGAEDRPRVRPIVQDIQQALHRFEEVQVVFSAREWNRVADKIAQESLSFQNHDPRLFSIVPVWLKTHMDAELCSSLG